MKTNSIIVIFLALIVILAVNPKMVNNIYNTILGRLFLISIVIFLSMKNITLGLLVALIIISGLNQFGSFVEGMETMPTSTTVGEENIPTTGKQIVLTDAETQKLDTAKQKVSDLKAKAAASGIDKEDIKNAIMSKDSKTIQSDPNMTSNENVDAFTTNMLTPSTLTEGFYSAALV
jgi:hypothetical protein